MCFFFFKGKSLLLLTYSSAGHFRYSFFIFILFWEFVILDFDEIIFNKTGLGATPLHWAALRGHSEACAVLVHAGTKEELTVKDNTGFTPVQLAYDKGHQNVAPFLVRTIVLIRPLIV